MSGGRSLRINRLGTNERKRRWPRHGWRSSMSGLTAAVAGRQAERSMRIYRKTIVVGVGILALGAGLVAIRDWRLRHAWRHEGLELLRRGEPFRALKYLAYSASESDIPTIVPYLDDKDPNVRFISAFALTLRSGHNIPVPPGLVYAGTVADSPRCFVMLDLHNEEVLRDEYVSAWRTWARTRK